VRGIYDGTKAKDVDRLMTEINVLLYTYDHNQ
jgi:protein SCO1/2